MAKGKNVIHCDLDAFFASVEQLDNPELRGKPVIVGGAAGERGVVSTCSYEARESGVHSAMPMKRAVELCPDAVVLRVNIQRYKEVSEQVFKILERFTPDIEPVSIDEAYLAVEEGRGIEIARKIRLAVKEELNLFISTGISVNKLLAKIACGMAKPDNLKALWPSDVEHQLWPLPVKVLPGVGPATEKKLKSLGIKTVGDLAKTAEESLKRALGSNGGFLKKYACGQDDRRIEPEHERKSISEEKTFPRDIFDAEQLLLVLQELSEEVGYRLRSSGMRSKTISLKLRFADFTTITRDKTLHESTDRDLDIYKTVEELFLKNKEKKPWRLAGVKASRLEKGYQLSLYPSGSENEREITLIRDKLRDKYGKNVLVNASRLINKKE